MFQLEDNEMTKQEQVSRSLGKDFMGRALVVEAERISNELFPVDKWRGNNGEV